MVSTPTITLKPTGQKMPQVGFGLWKVTDNTADTVYNAIKTGYRLLDGACGMVTPPRSRMYVFLIFF